MARDPNYTPFSGPRRTEPPAEFRTLREFRKAGHVATICERKVTPYQALEFFVFIDGGLVASQLFHGARLSEYDAQLKARVAQFVGGGWVEHSEAATLRRPE